MYLAQGLDPNGNKSYVVATLGLLILVSFSDLSILMFIFLEQGFKDNVLIKSLITSEDLSRRNRKNAMTVSGHLASCSMIMVGCTICLLFLYGLGHFAVYFVPFLNVIFGSVFPFFQILVTPELRKHILCNWS